EMALLLENGGPWGQGCPEPLFHDKFGLVTQRVVGERHLKLVLQRGERLFDGIAFHTPPLAETSMVDVVYRLSENDYGGLPTLQLVVEHVSVLA
ncbi:MAG: single-stranded-DNA-specific exonuclease RecJ, partial [Gammaproteobacteria bacterium]|nr:single-stranded-DNA-specific exonuclease RecJ [Gammaproteobacteria bacterium]